MNTPSPASAKRADLVNMDLTPVEMPFHEVHYAVESGLNGAPLLIRGTVTANVSIGTTKTGSPFYCTTLISLTPNPVCIRHSFGRLFHTQNPGPDGEEFHDRIRLVAFGDHAPRTSGILLKDNVVDVIHPRVARANAQWSGDATVPYELRVIPETVVRIFREDQKNKTKE